MYNLKQLVGVVGSCAVLFAAGCGIPEENQISSYENSDAEADFYVEDDSFLFRRTAPEGSLDTFYGKYQIQGAEGVWYYFDEENICYYVQQGTYSFSHDINADGVESDMVSMQFDTQSAHTNYTIENTDGQLTLRATYSGDEAETAIDFAFLTGMDKMADMELFEGIYSAYNMENYRYEFHSDGTFYVILEEAYAANDATLTLSAFGRDLTYDYAASDGNLELSSEGTEIASLIPCK